MVLGILPVPGRPTNSITVGPTVLVGVVLTFLLSLILSSFSLSGRRPDID